MSSAIPARTVRGVRNANPTCLRRSPIPWTGKLPSTDPDFEQFIDAHHGIRAGAVNLLTYYRKHKLSTVAGIIDRWAPPADDNDTASYISRVSEELGVTPDTKLDLEEPDVLASLVTAIIRVECDGVPYAPEQVRAAVNSAYSGGMPPTAGPAAPPGVTVVPGPPVPQAAVGIPTPQVLEPAPGPVPPNQERPVPPLVDQPDGSPTRKVQAIPIGGLAGVPVAWVAKVLWDKAIPEQPMPVEVAMAIAGLVSTLGAYLAAYFTRNRETVPPPPPTPYGQGFYHY